MGKEKPSNIEIANVLERIADLLEVQGANPFRIRSYRNGALSVRSAEDSLARMVRENQMDAVKNLPYVGEGLASTISEFVKTGRIRLLDRLQGEVSPEDVFKQVPGIGEDLARRVAEELDIHSLEELERAAHEGRLDKIKGFGKKRLQSVKISLAGMLSQSVLKKFQRRSEESLENRPSVGLLLELDEEYRQKAQAGKLKKNSPAPVQSRGKSLAAHHARRKRGLVFHPPLFQHRSSS